MMRFLLSILLIFCLSFGHAMNHLTPMLAQEEVTQADHENIAIQDFEKIHEQSILATPVTEGTTSEDIKIDTLSFDEIIEYNEENQRMLSLLYDDEQTEIILYFIDDNLTYLGWTNYESSTNPIGEGYISDTNELKASINKIDEGNQSKLEIVSGNEQVYFDYNAEIANSQRHAFEFLIKKADLDIEILINTSATPNENLTESKEASIEEASLDYGELVENPAWLVDETNQPPSDLIEAYERIKSGGDPKLGEPDHSNEYRDVYLGSTADLFVELEITKKEPLMVTLNHFTPDIYQSFPENFDSDRTYTIEELVDKLGPVTIKQLDLDHSIERYAWIRLAGDTSMNVLNAYPESESGNEYTVKFNEIEE